MPKTITLRLSEEAYRKFNAAAIEDNRSISNLIETLALKKLNEEIFVDNFEMEEILSNTRLLKKLEKGHAHAKVKKGKLIG
ncbi:MAG: CopG family transcriptional regulator [Thermodesulfovibrio sp.]|nr:CopG family transcriptional regulator [Thermodesulfovibrio sp.]